MRTRAKNNRGVTSRPRVFSLFVRFFDDFHSFRGGQVIVVGVLRGNHGVAAASRAGVFGVFVVRPRFVLTKFLFFGGVRYRAFDAVFCDSASSNSKGSTIFSSRRTKANAS